MAVITAFCVHQSDSEKHCMLDPIYLAPIDLVSYATCKMNSGSKTLTGS